MTITDASKELNRPVSDLRNYIKQKTGVSLNSDRALLNQEQYELLCRKFGKKTEKPEAPKAEKMDIKPQPCKDLSQKGCLSQKDIERDKRNIDELYSEFDRLCVVVKNTYERMLKMRQLLEVSYSLILNPKQTFSKAFNATVETNDKQLAQKMDEYYKIHSSNLKSVASMLRSQLNSFIHTYQFVTISEQRVVDLLNKERGVIDSLFNRKTSAPSGPVLRSIFDVNPEQENAVNSDQRVTAVIAGPGSGKTFLIVDRIIRSMRKAGDKKILGLAFSNEAARNLKNRFDYKVFGTEDFENSSLVSVSTIHSFAFNSLKAYYEHSKKKFPYEIIDEFELKKIKSSFQGNIELINNYISENSLLTFDMIIELCLNEIQAKDGQFAHFLADQYYEILVDEAQDLTPDDCRILWALYNASSSLRIFIVGDQRQNIYAFRHGSMHNLLDVGFKPSYFTLKRSYRCPDSVLQFVNGFHFSDCKNNPLENPEVIGDPVCLKRVKAEIDELQYFIACLQKLEQEKDFDWSQVAILFSYSTSFDEYAKALNQAKIPFRTFGGKTELKTEIQAFIYFIGAIEGRKYSLLQFMASMLLNNMPPGIKKTMTFEKVLLYIKGKSPIAKPFIELIEKYFDKKKGYKLGQSQDSKNHLSLDDIFEDYIRVANVTMEVMTNLKDFVHTLTALDMRTYADLKQKMSPFIEDFYKFYDTPTVASEFLEKGNSSYVSISTMHSSKGKEWQYVFIPGLTEDKYPKYRATNIEINEELKKFYVACTRAKKQLFLMSSEEYIVRSPRGEFPQYNKRPSMFVKMLPVSN